jgi:NADPH:quinone reductase-like Zn-dependent oxidoreductase
MNKRLKSLVFFLPYNKSEVMKMIEKNNEKKSKKAKVNKTMKAAVCARYGSPEVLQYKEVPKPTPKDNEVLIRIYATTASSTDRIIRSFSTSFAQWLPMRLFLGVTKPRKSILGVVLSGEIEKVGKNVKDFKRGDQIYATTGLRFGTYAQYTCLPENSVMAQKPSNITYNEAAAIPFGGVMALHFLRKVNIQRGHKVLIYGASGATGTSAVQLAKYFGAEVTGVSSTKNLEFVRSLGADSVIDYKKEDFTESEERYDIIFDAVGKISKGICKKSLAPYGKFVSVEGSGIAKPKAEHLILLRELVESGRLKPVIDRQYPLKQISKAHKYLDKGHKRGSIIIDVA